MARQKGTRRYMQLDHTFPGGKKVKLLRAKFGDSGPWVYCVIGCHIMGSSEGQITLEELDVLRTDTCCDAETWQAIVTHLFDKDWLYKTEQGFIRSSGTDSDLADLQKKSEAGRKGGKASAAARAGTTVDKTSTTVPQNSTTVEEKSTDARQQPYYLDININNKKEQSGTYGKRWQGIRLWLDGSDYASLVMNHYHGNEMKLVQDLPFFDDLATKNNKTFESSEQCAAQIRFYIKQKQVFKPKEQEPKKDNRPRPRAFVPVWEREKEK